MGVYNPNMEMPRNCTECIEFKEDCDHYWDYYCTHESRPNDCPLIEIPAPHGRLIDEREVKKAQFIINDQWGSYPVISLGNLNCVPTILEAEE